MLVLAVLPASPLTAQTVSVIATPGLRPTAILAPHLQYVVAADSLGQGAVIRDVAIGPVAFAGEITIRGVRPGESSDIRGFQDTVRFEPDGRVLLRIADERGREPIHAEMFGSRTGQGAMLVLTARNWPIGRAMVVSIAPTDLYEAVYRGTGYGVRDRIRIDDRTSFAFLSDTSAGTTTVAIGLGRGSRGRIQGESVEQLIERDYGGTIGRDRRTLGALTLALEPSREEGGFVRAEILFGVGNSEPEALQAARSGADDPSQRAAVLPLRVATPAANVNLLVSQIIAAAAGALDWDRFDASKVIVSSARRPTVRAEDAWYGVSLATQRGDTAAVCGSYRLLRANVGPDGLPRAIVPRLGRGGRTASAVRDDGGDAALVLLAHACYRANRDALWIRSELPALLAGSARATAAGLRLAPAATAAVFDIEDELSRLPGGTRSPRADSLRALVEGRPRDGVLQRAPTVLWQDLTTSVARGVQREYGRLTWPDSAGGLSMAYAGAWLDEFSGELFGVAERLDYVTIAPRIDGIADEFTWRLEGWQLSRDTLGLVYRPADRAATIRIGAARRTRVELAFPWLRAESCVRATRGSTTERLSLVELTGGRFYFDLRAFDQPATVVVTAAACGG